MIRNNSASIKGLLNRYRVEIYCLNCGASYVSRLISSGGPIECKECRSTKIQIGKKWRY